MSSGGLGGVLLVFGAFIVLILYVIAMLVITFWYIIIPAIALIIVYKYRKSIWKPKDTTFLNDEVREHYKNGTMHDYYGEHDNSSQQHGGAWHERQEWIKQQAAEDERRAREFWEHFWKNYESEFGSRNDQKALDDETVEERRKRGDENFEESWEEFKQKFDQEDDENYAKYYKLLGIPTDATYDEVRKRFRELVLKYHPDRYIGSKKKAAEKFKKIFEAYQKIMERMRVRA